MQLPFPLPSWFPSWLPGGSPPNPFPIEDVRSNLDRVREIAAQYGVTVVAIGQLPAGDSGSTIAQAARGETVSEFERLLRMTDFERLLERTVFELPDRPASDRDPTWPRRNPPDQVLPSTKRTRIPGGPVKDFELPPPPKPPLPPGGPIKDFPLPVPVPPPPGAGGAGGGGVGSLLGGLLQLPVVRAAGRVLEAVGPVLDVATIWREYLSYPEQLQRQIDEARRRTRRTGPPRRAAPRSTLQSQNVRPAPPAARARARAPAPRSASQPAPGALWNPLPGEVPDYTRPPGPVATRRDTSRQPVSERAPVQMPGWQWLSNPGLQAGVRRAVETLAAPGPAAQSPLSYLAGSGPAGRATPSPRPAPRSSPASTSSSAASVPRCPSSDPCMRRAADKRREQRKRAKECKSKVKVQREVTVCQQSK